MRFRFPWWKKDVDRLSDHASTAGVEPAGRPASDARSDESSVPSSDGQSALRAHHESLTKRARDQHDDLADAIEVLERALAEIPRDGPRDWTARVAAELETVRTCMRRHAEGVEEPEGLFDEIKTVQPRLAARAEALQREHVSLAECAAGLARDLSEGTHDVETVRRETAKLLSELRSHRTFEAELVYEAFWTELGAGD